MQSPTVSDFCHVYVHVLITMTQVNYAHTVHHKRSHLKIHFVNTADGTSSLRLIRRLLKNTNFDVLL